MPTAWGTCWPSSWSPQVSWWWTCRPGWPRGSGCWDRGRNKNDPDDARSVAIAALRSAACLRVRADDHAAVLKVWAKRHRDLSRSRNQVVCRLHAVLCQLIPGGVSKRITAGQAARILEAAEPLRSRKQPLDVGQ